MVVDSLEKSQPHCLIKNTGKIPIKKSNGLPIALK
jgi:hypothetical protein